MRYTWDSYLQIAEVEMDVQAILDIIKRCPSCEIVQKAKDFLNEIKERMVA